MSISTKIKYYREKAKMSQKELAAKTGVDQETIFSWENDLEIPNPAELETIARALNVSSNDLAKAEVGQDFPTHSFSESQTPDSIFRKYLRGGEEIIWSGQPVSGKLPTRQTLPVAFFGLFFLGFSIFWMVMAVGHAGGYFALFGVPFVLIGAYIVFGRLGKGTKFQDNTFYALTSERLLICSTQNGETLNEMSLNKIPFIQINKNLDNTGTLIFQDPNRNNYGGYQSNAFGSHHYSSNSQPLSVSMFQRMNFAFINIKDVQDVYDKINALKSKTNQ